jgi:histidine triad (HIT) family protein
MKEILFSIARSSFSSFFIGFAFEHMTYFMPIDRLFENNRVIVFRHPVPSWQFHYLAVPKKKIPALLTLDLQTLSGKEVIRDILSSLQLIAKDNQLTTYQIVVNGGKYQDVPQMHFHLNNGIKSNGEPDQLMNLCLPLTETPEDEFQTALLFSHPQPRRSVHYIMISKNTLPNFQNCNISSDVVFSSVLDMIALTQMTVIKKNLNAFSLVIDVVEAKPDTRLCFHLVSGSRLRL